jgi:hypothetical protein
MKSLWNLFLPKTGALGRSKTTAMPSQPVKLEHWNIGVMGKQIFQPDTPILHHSILSLHYTITPLFCWHVRYMSGTKAGSFGPEFFI